MSSGRWPSPEYRYRITFRAPLPFVYRWCTDYAAVDAKLEKDRYQRKIVSRGPREVIYEDLLDGPKGWWWTRHVVTLSPPNRWHSDSVGNYREFRLDYELKEIDGDRTELRFRARRRPGALGKRNPSKAAFDKMMVHTWVNFRRHLERDYRQSRVGRARRA